MLSCARFSPLAMLLALLAGPDAQSANCGGGECGGGGNARVCRNGHGKIIGSPLLLDLYEGREAEGLSYDIRAKNSVEQELTRAVEKFEKSVGGEKNPQDFWYQSIPYWYWEDVPTLGTQSVLSYLKNFNTNFIIQADNSGLPPLDDSHPEVIPKEKNCKIERLAWYIDGKIHLDGEIWSAMDNRSRAALIFHEAAYRYDRLFRGAQDSNEARKVVRRAFAKQPLVSVTEGITKETSRCVGETGAEQSWSEFYVQRDHGKISISFASLLNRHFYSNTSVSFNGLPKVEHDEMGTTTNSWRSLPTMRLELETTGPTEGKPVYKTVLWIQGDENWPDTRIHLEGDKTSFINCWPRLRLTDSAQSSNASPGDSADSDDGPTPHMGNAK